MITLYTVDLSGNGIKARMLLSMLGLDYETKKPDMMKGEHKSPDFLKLNPLGQVPVLIDGGVTFAIPRRSWSISRGNMAATTGCRPTRLRWAKSCSGCSSPPTSSIRGPTACAWPPCSSSMSTWRSRPRSPMARSRSWRRGSPSMTGWRSTGAPSPISPAIPIRRSPIRAASTSRPTRRYRRGSGDVEALPGYVGMPGLPQGRLTMANQPNEPARPNRKLRSRITVEGLDRTPHRAFMRGMGAERRGHRQAVHRHRHRSAPRSRPATCRCRSQADEAQAGRRQGRRHAARLHHHLGLRRHLDEPSGHAF